MTHEHEIGFIPLCQMASITSPLRKHYRKMYNKFCLNTENVQKRILEIKDVPKLDVHEKDWWLKYLVRFENDYEKLNLGSKGHMYIFRQYLIRLLYYGNEQIEDCLDYDCLSKGKNVIASAFPFYVHAVGKIITEFISRMQHQEYENNLKPPLDRLWKEFNLAECDELSIAMFTALFIIQTCHTLPLDSDKPGLVMVYSGPSLYELDTAEDLFYLTLLTLYETYEKDLYAD